MKKEVLIAVVLGIIVGLVITFGMYTANTALQRKAQQTKDAVPIPTPSSATLDAQHSSIIMYGPEDNMLTDKDKVRLSGSTSPNATLVIFVNDKEVIAVADGKGNFSAELSLVGGSNVITTISTDTNGKQDQDQRSVVFSTASLDDAPSASVSATPKPSASSATTMSPKVSPSVKASPLLIATNSGIPNQDTVTQNIKDRIEKIIDEKSEKASQNVKKRAFVGKVSRVTTESLSIETLRGEQNVKVSLKSTVLLFPKMQSLQLSDIEIGGFAIVMGYINSDDVLEAKRILVVQTPLFPMKKKVTIGRVIDLSTTMLSLKLRNNEEEKIPVTKKTVYVDSQGESLKRTEVEDNAEVIVIRPNADDASASASVVRLVK